MLNFWYYFEDMSYQIDSTELPRGLISGSGVDGKGRVWEEELRVFFIARSAPQDSYCFVHRNQRFDSV